MIFIDYNDKRPIYEQVTEKIQTLILNGVLESDSKLPSVRSLAMELSINPNTIQRAYVELERQGYIYSVKGKGSYVAENHQIREKNRQEVLKSLEALVEKAEAAGVTMLEFQEAVIQMYGKKKKPEEGEGGERYD